MAKAVLDSLDGTDWDQAKQETEERLSRLCQPGMVVRDRPSESP